MTPPDGGVPEALDFRVEAEALQVELFDNAEAAAHVKEQIIERALRNVAAKGVSMAMDQVASFDGSPMGLISQLGDLWMRLRWEPKR